MILLHGRLGHKPKTKQTKSKNTHTTKRQEKPPEPRFRSFVWFRGLPGWGGFSGYLLGFSFVVVLRGAVVYPTRAIDRAVLQ